MLIYFSSIYCYILFIAQPTNVVKTHPQYLAILFNLFTNLSAYTNYSLYIRWTYKSIEYNGTEYTAGVFGSLSITELTKDVIFTHNYLIYYTFSTCIHVF